MSVFSVFSQAIYLETARPLYLLAVFSVSRVFRGNRVSKKNISRKNLAPPFFCGGFLSRRTHQKIPNTLETLKTPLILKGFFSLPFGAVLGTLKTLGRLKIYISAMTYAK
jgi:hypothetical protein